jgi:hypothetical protein
MCFLVKNLPILHYNLNMIIRILLSLILLYNVSSSGVLTNFEYFNVGQQNTAQEARVQSSSDLFNESFCSSDINFGHDLGAYRPFDSSRSQNWVPLDNSSVRLDADIKSFRIRVNGSCFIVPFEYKVGNEQHQKYFLDILERNNINLEDAESIFESLFLERWKVLKQLFYSSLTKGWIRGKLQGFDMNNFSKFKDLRGLAFITHIDQMKLTDSKKREMLYDLFSNNREEANRRISYWLNRFSSKERVDLEKYYKNRLDQVWV